MDPAVVGEITARIMRRLVRIRKQRRLTCGQLAEQITTNGFPITQAMLSKYEVGRVKYMSVDMLLGVASALGVPPGALLVEATCASCKTTPVPAPRCCDVCGYAP